MLLNVYQTIWEELFMFEKKDHLTESEVFEDHERFIETIKESLNFESKSLKRGDSNFDHITRFGFSIQTENGICQVTLPYKKETDFYVLGKCGWKVDFVETGTVRDGFDTFSQVVDFLKASFPKSINPNGPADEMYIDITNLDENSRKRLLSMIFYRYSTDEQKNRF